jgi:hypothetical protein
VTQRLVAVIVLGALVASTSACAPRTRAGKTAMVVGGAAIALSGAAMFNSFLDENGDLDGLVLCAIGGCAISGLLIAGGSVLAMSGLSGPTEEPAPLAVVDAPAPVRPLPEVAVDPETLRLAKQVRNAVVHDDCATARQLLIVIAARDRRYHDALAASVVMDGCRAAHD